MLNLNLNLYDATTYLFAQLGIPLNSNTALAFDAQTILKEHYKDREPYNCITQLYFAGLINDSVFDKSRPDGYSYEDAQEEANNSYEGLMLFALELSKDPTRPNSPTRSEMSELTRAFNRISQKMPVALLIKCENMFSIALSERFKYKQEWRQGEKVGKVIILRNINSEKPHRGHLQILEDLSKHNAKNFNELHKAWLDVLDVDVLNKTFYKRLVKWYELCLNDIEIDLVAASRILNKKIDDELKPQAVIRVIIRLMFIWFMKEKKLIKDIFFSKTFAQEYLQNENTYYNAVLQNLFFAVLNKKIDDRRFRKHDNVNRKNPDKNDYGIFDVFRYKAFFKLGKADEFLELTKEIPFVNGGLFQCHDYIFSGKDIVTNEKNSINNYIIDGFSERKNCRAIISDTVIFELIDMFNDYVFTIEEATPTEQDIALDPELLGTIFENLIGFYNPETKETAREKTGSFYTPPEIVNYMCSESLKESLKTKFPDLHAQIDRLIDNNEDYLNFPEKNRMSAAITDLKVIDPACGSGAFPMGMFNLMVRTIEKLQERKTTYKNKLDIIENCIYGIDIQNIAVEISKLRFFISLLVDCPMPENIDDFEVLPNLETKFVVANTLIGLNLNGYGDAFSNPVILPKCKELTQIFLPFTGAKTSSEKTYIKNKFNAKKNEIVEEINALMNGSKIKDEDAEKISAWDPFNVCYCASFFDSRIMFGLTGFDIVIGNPPYVQVPKGVFSKKQFPYSEGKDKGKQNLYKVFVEASYNMLIEGGITTMIVQSSLMCDISSQFTRELLLTKTEIKEFIEFPKKAKKKEGQVFESVLQGTCIYQFKKRTPEKDRAFKVSIDNDVTTLKNLQYETLRQCEIIQFYPNGFFVPLVRINEFEIIRKIKKKSFPLKEIIIAKSQGDLNQTTNKNSFSDNLTDVKLLRGRNIHRYFVDYNSSEYIKTDFKVNSVNLNQTKRYLVGQRTTGTVDKNRLHFAISETNEKYLFNEHVNKVLLNQDTLFVMSVLNSSLMDWYFRKTSTNNEVNGYEIEQFPICKNINKEQQQPIITLVNQILSAKKKNPAANIAELEKEIDELVYDLYGMDNEEIKIIKGGK